jgi:MFS transporter, PPP family, 3-phenylpropionic acid transporter
MLVSPIYGYVNDRFSFTKLMLIIASAGAILAALGISMVQSYAAILLLVGIFALFFTPMVPVIDSINLQILGENRSQFGRQRFWGTFGFILTSLTFGFLLNFWELRIIFPGFALMMLGTLVMYFWLPTARVATTTRLGSGFFTFVKNPEWLLLTASLLLLSTASTGMMIFLGIYIQELGGSESLIGGASALGAAVEMPVMFFSMFFFRIFSARRILLLSFFFYSLRFFLYSIAPSPEWVLVISLFHGVTYAFYLISSVAYTNELAPEGLKSTGQGLLMATFHLGTISGAISGGLMYDTFGAQMLFRVYAGFALSALLLQLVGSSLLANLRRS